MDKVRFGRALGYGARHAARAVAQAVEAATAQPAATPPPTSAASSRPAAAPSPRTAPPTSATDSLRQALHTAQQSHSQAQTHARSLGKSVFSPVARFSSVLWLQVTGTFYALIAVVVAQALWTRRSGLHLPASSPEAQKLYLLVAVAALFTYFALSSFLRAHRRERR